jgi:hypothetical protein
MKNTDQQNANGAGSPSGVRRRGAAYIHHPRKIVLPEISVWKRCGMREEGVWEEN